MALQIQLTLLKWLGCIVMNNSEHSHSMIAWVVVLVLVAGPWPTLDAAEPSDAERFVRSIKSACLAQIIPLGDNPLRKAVKEYTEHYYIERNHQGLGNELIMSPKLVPLGLHPPL